MFGNTCTSLLVRFAGFCPPPDQPVSSISPISSWMKSILLECFNSRSSGSELLDSIPRQVYLFSVSKVELLALKTYTARPHAQDYGAIDLKLIQKDVNLHMPRISAKCWHHFLIQLKPRYLHIIINISVQGPQEVDHICQENLPSASVDLFKNHLRILLWWINPMLVIIKSWLQVMFSIYY